MTKSEMAARLNEANAFGPGKKVKLDFGDEGVVMLDGAGSTVNEEDGDADTTIKVAWQDWEDMAAGKLDGTDPAAVQAAAISMPPTTSLGWCEPTIRIE